MKHLVLISTLFIFCFGAFAQTEEFVKAGDALASKGKYEEAILEYNKAVDIEETNLNARMQRAMAYNLLKQYENAIEDYNVILAQKPELTSIRNSRGTALMKLEKYDSAMSDFNTIISADPKNQEAYNNRGWCKKHLGDKEGACSDWKTSKKLGNSEAKLILENNGC